MALGYNLNIPFENNNPSDDQPLMKENTNSISTIISEDHYTFTSSTYGQHLYSRFPLQQTPPAPTGQASVAYPSPGNVQPTSTHYYFKNANANYMLSAIRSFGSIIVPGNNISPYNVTATIVNGFNILSIPTITRGLSTCPVTINLNPGTLDTNGIITDQACLILNPFLPTTHAAITYSYTIDSSAETISITFDVSRLPNIQFNYILLQS